MIKCVCSNLFQAQIGLLIILLIAIVDFVIGSIIGPKSDEELAQGFLGYNSKCVYLSKIVNVY